MAANDPIRSLNFWTIVKHSIALNVHDRMHSLNELEWSFQVINYKKAFQCESGQFLLGRKTRKSNCATRAMLNLTAAVPKNGT